MIYCCPIIFEQEHTHHCELAFNAATEITDVIFWQLMEACSFSFAWGAILWRDVFWTRCCLGGCGCFCSPRSTARGLKNFGWVMHNLLVPVVDHLCFASGRSTKTWEPGQCKYGMIAYIWLYSTFLSRLYKYNQKKCYDKSELHWYILQVIILQSTDHKPSLFIGLQLFIWVFLYCLLLLFYLFYVWVALD